MLPLVVYAAAIAVIDPFDYFRLDREIPLKVKLETSVRLNPCLWKMIEFQRDPRPNLLLGDSRMAELQEDDVSRVAGRPFANMAYGGASLNEVIQTFWFANSVTHLREVWIGLGFHMYNDYNYTTRTEAFTSIRKNPLLYFTNRTVVKCAAYNLFYTFDKRDPGIGVPQGTPEQFWNEEVGPLTANWYTRYVYPRIYHRELKEISDYCVKNGIKLGFIIFPTHVDLQRRVDDFDLQDYYARFKTELAELGSTYDFDYRNALTEDRKNFHDPYHFTEPVAEEIICQIWQRGTSCNGTPKPGRLLNSPFARAASRISFRKRSGLS